MTCLFYEIIGFSVRYFPLKFNYAMSRFLADIFCLFPTKLKQDVHYNLDKIYKLKGEEVEISKKVREVFRNFARYLIDLVCLDVLPKSEISKLFLDIEGREYLNAVKNKGAILVTIHMGNWELGGAFLTHNGYDFTAIFEKHENENLTRFFNNIRLKHKFGIVYRKDIKSIIQVIKDKKVLTILGDLNYDNQTVSVKFLGVDYNLPAGAVVLALKFEVPIISAICTQSGKGYKLLALPLLKMEKSGNLAQDIKTNAQRLANILEGFILKYPEQWFVFKRFDKNET